jgi:RNA polymerase sigma-70 factor (ECF subfamily)
LADEGLAATPGRVVAPPSDAALVARCRTGDQASWRLLVERHASLVNAILRGGFRMDGHDAQDAFQEVFTRLYLRLGELRNDQSVGGWIAATTRNVALDWVRRRAREVPSGESLDTAAFEEPLRAVDEALVVRAALERLPAHQQEILDRFFVRDESYQTIAAALDLPPGTIASRISRALAALRSVFESEF